MFSGPVLVVCTGNICRSPFAARYLEKRLLEAKKAQEVRSCGLMAYSGNRVTAEAMMAARRFDVDLSGHRACPLDDVMVERAGLILVMERRQGKMIERMYPQTADRIFLLSHMSRGALAGRDIDDPYGMGVDVYVRVYGQIVHHANAWLDRLIAGQAIPAGRRE
jgi:protein-tyrosine phosphatase